MLGSEYALIEEIIGNDPNKLWNVLGYITN